MATAKIKVDWAECRFIQTALSSHEDKAKLVGTSNYTMKRFEELMQSLRVKLERAEDKIAKKST